MTVFFVSSPFQAISAKEAIEHYKIKEYELYVFKGKRGKPNTQLFSTFKYLNLHYTSVIEFNSLFKLYFSLKGLIDITRIDKVFLGDIESFSERVLLLFLRNTKVPIYLLDDGNSAINIWFNKFHYTYNNNKNKLKYFIFNSILGNRKTIENRVKFFSLFLEANDLVDRNHLDFLKTLKISKSTPSGVYILGSDIVEANIISLSDYINYLHKFINTLDEDTSIYYVPHRGENKLKLDLLKKRFSFKYIEAYLPVELYFIRRQINPNIVFGFSSTALFSLKLLFDSVVIDANWTSSINDTGLRNTYKLISSVYEKHNIDFLK